MYIGESEPSSWSVPTAEQLNKSPTAVPVVAVILALVVKYGAVFSTVTESEPLSLPPFVSLTVTVQSMMLDGSLIDGSNCNVLDVEE